MIGFKVDVEFVWGFQARIAGLSKTSPSFYYPPPTTFLGALAEAIAKDHSFGEKNGLRLLEKLSESLLAIGLKPLNCFPIKYADVNRILAVKITSGILYPTPKDLGKSFDSPARGKTILAALDDDPPKIRWFLVFGDDEINFSGESVNLHDALWKIHRLGSKESRVSVVDVVKTDVEVEKGRTITEYCFPLEDGVDPKSPTGRWDFEVYLNPFEVRYNQSENPVMNYISGKRALAFRIPIMKTAMDVPSYVVDVGGNFVAFSDGRERVIGRWSE